MLLGQRKLGLPRLGLPGLPGPPERWQLLLAQELPLAWGPPG
jgi:hypothetical protein